MLEDKVGIRAARAEDVEWLEPFYESLMRPYVELTHEWDTTIFRKCFDPEVSSIIQYDGQDIGLLVVKDRDDGIYLGDLQLKTEFQGKGIGTYLMKQVLISEHRGERDIRLRVLKGNPAINLYRRLGFKVDQELDNAYQMILSKD